MQIENLWDEVEDIEQTFETQQTNEQEDKVLNWKALLRRSKAAVQSHLSENALTHFQIEKPDVTDGNAVR